ncbi:PP2C family serine/threonine-protein phosphatase [Kitasatospora sp. NPDC059408]|uniref:PP2C family serine/threonine-protein phosphatase n=1 Tax=Kitasatospora sp. NPDC059408 TaxID=3346823 RepID=UPI0036C9F951
MRSYASAQLVGDRSHQCDAVATRATADGGRAYALLDGIGSNDEVRAWTRMRARRLAVLTARTLQPHEAISRVQDEVVTERALDADGEVEGACAVIAVTGPDALLRVAWIGDCRAYLLDASGRLTRLTTDHNERAVIEALGGVAPRWARNYVTRCLGAEAGGDALFPEWTAVHDRTGARLLLASDGCYEPIEDAGRDLAHELDRRLGPADCANHLVRLAISLGGAHRDNATCLVADL